jgi:RNA polymerase sigma factor (sigma-70 family)
MKEERDFERENFEALLRWLDADRDGAGRRYEEIRRALIKIFASRGCAEPEHLADETINRVCRRVGKVAPGYVGDCALYFYGVAQRVHLEHLRRERRRARRLRLVESTQLAAAIADSFEREFRCLERCIARLPARSRELLLEYYGADRRAKIDARKQLAARLGIEPGALRLRVFRLRNAVARCVRACAEGRANLRETDRARRQ